MNWFERLPRSSKTPPGRERALLRLMPRLLVLGTILLGLPSLGARLFPWDATEAEVAALVMRVDILAVSGVLVHWTAVVTVAIGALIVVIMKGPAYVADAYPIDDSAAPQGPRSPS
jgi:hypothetical protein